MAFVIDRAWWNAPGAQKETSAAFATPRCKVWWIPDNLLLVVTLPGLRWKISSFLLKEWQNVNQTCHQKQSRMLNGQYMASIAGIAWTGQHLVLLLVQTKHEKDLQVSDPWVHDMMAASHPSQLLSQWLLVHAPFFSRVLLAVISSTRPQTCCLIPLLSNMAKQSLAWRIPVPWPIFGTPSSISSPHSITNTAVLSTVSLLPVMSGWSFPSRWRRRGLM